MDAVMMTAVKRTQTISRDGQIARSSGTDFLFLVCFWEFQSIVVQIISR
jgi:hypothetical protein